jgi:chloramphenicol 3-O phosphotransferase
MTVDGTGSIILINGTSSSGKTTLVKGLQRTLPELWLEMGIDRFAYALPDRVHGEDTWQQLFRYVRPEGRADGPFTIETTALGHRFISGIHATAAALAERGLNIIVDQVLLDGSWLEECARLWAAFPVLFVGVRCPLEVVLERERERGNRTPGQAEAQYDVVHRWGTYDVEVDTSVLTTDEAIARITVAFDALLARGTTGLRGGHS